MYGGNIPAGHAGQVEPMEFSVPQGPGVDNVLLLDSVVFSANPVPEPGPWALAMLGVAGLLIQRHGRNPFSATMLKGNIICELAT